MIALRHLAFLAPCVWGSTYYVTTQFLPDDKPLLAALIRALPAGLILICGARLPEWRWLLRLLVLGALNIGLFFILLFSAAYRVPGGVVALIGALQPLAVIALSSLLLAQRASRSQLLAAGLGAVGVFLLIALPSGRLDPVGLLAAFLATLSMGSGLVLTKKWGRPPRMSMMTFTGWQLLAGGLVVLPAQLLTESLPAALTLTNLLGYAWVAIPGSLCAYWLWFAGVEANPPVVMSLLGLLSPLVALIIGYALLDQTLNASQRVGALLIFSVVLMVQWGNARRVPAS